MIAGTDAWDEFLSPVARAKRLYQKRKHLQKLADRFFAAQIVFSLLAMLSYAGVDFRLSQLIAITVEGPEKFGFYVLLAQLLLIMASMLSTVESFSEIEMRFLLEESGKHSAARRIHEYFPDVGSGMNIDGLLEKIDGKQYQKSMILIASLFTAPLILFAYWAPVAAGAWIIFENIDSASGELSSFSWLLLLSTVGSAFSVLSFYFSLTLGEKGTFLERMRIRGFERSKWTS